MGWVTLTLRKLTLRSEINSMQLRDLQLSRKLRSVHRNLSYEQSVFNSDKKRELADAKKDYMEIRGQREGLDPQSQEYADWSIEYGESKADYEEAKLEINEYYDDIMREIEEAASDEEQRIQEEQTTLEAQLESMKEELGVVSEQISKDIQDSKLNLK